MHRSKSRGVGGCVRGCGMEYNASTHRVAFSAGGLSGAFRLLLPLGLFEQRTAHFACSGVSGGGGRCVLRACVRPALLQETERHRLQSMFLYGGGEKQFLWRPPHHARHTACFIGADRCGCFGYSQIRNKSAYAQEEKSLGSIFVLRLPDISLFDCGPR
jgi:hypothetical protein